MNSELKQKWIAALRSGNYEQADHRLRRVRHGNVSYCCLGVLLCVSGRYRVFGNDENEYYGFINAELGDATRSQLAGMNDYQGRTFAEIADYIEQTI
jgi:hypothetical protein